MSSDQARVDGSDQANMSIDQAPSDGSVYSAATYNPLSLCLFKARNIGYPPLDMLNMVDTALFGNLTIGNVLNFCTACNVPPTAPMLAIALQNSIPSLTGLPMDNPDTAFYIDIAKRFFGGSVNIPIRPRSDMYAALQPGRFMGILRNRANVEAPVEGFSSGVAYYAHVVLQNDELLSTKKGRDFIKGVILEWLETPLDEQMVKVYNHLINVLDHGLVLRNRKLLPGCIGQFKHSIEQDEHK